jgi:hypothetical protein
MQLARFSMACHRTRAIRQSGNGKPEGRGIEKRRREWRRRPEDSDELKLRIHRLGGLLDWGSIQDRHQDREFSIRRKGAYDSGTPLGDVPIPDFSSDQFQSTLDMSQDQFDQTRQANVQTLHQMFPALEEDIVEAVLEGCGDDLGVAIDRLLEM